MGPVTGTQAWQVAAKGMNNILGIVATRRRDAMNEHKPGTVERIEAAWLRGVT
jgi:hypothetical protein